MPRQNRVTPFDRFEANPARGLLMGNRGILHDEHGQLGSTRWKHKNWIVCVTSFKDRRRTVMSPGCYTELFFCDEPTALAAGHRPCAECRREDYKRFAAAWKSAYTLATEPRAAEMDDALHSARLIGRKQARTPAVLGNVPDGAVVALPEHPDRAWLVWRDRLHLWSHRGYAERQTVVPEQLVNVLTPEPAIRTLRARHVAVVHASAYANQDEG